MQTLLKLTIVFFVISLQLQGQEAEIDRLIQNEFKMTFPSIHFKHKSIDYANMPYSADSCLKYIASHFNETINSLVIWRDTAETEELTIKRIKKLKLVLKKYIRTNEFTIYSMGNDQKVFRHTIKMTTDSLKIKYLLSLNSVFDISKTKIPLQAKTRQSHVFRPKLFCWSCIKSGYHLDKKSRNLRKVARLSKQNKRTSDKQ